MTNTNIAVPGPLVVAGYPRNTTDASLQSRIDSIAETTLLPVNVMQIEGTVSGVHSTLSKGVFNITRGAYIYIRPTARNALDGFGYVMLSKSAPGLCEKDLLANNFTSGLAEWEVWANGLIWTTRSVGRTYDDYTCAAMVVRDPNNQITVNQGGIWEMVVQGEPFDEVPSFNYDMTAPLGNFDNLTVIGDYKSQYLAHLYYLNGAPASSVFPTSPELGVGPSSATGTGVLYFRAADKYMSWQAPSDTQGAWTPVQAGGITLLPSGSADRELRLYLYNDIGFPTVDSQVNVTVTNATFYGYRTLNPIGWMMQKLNQPFATVHQFGIGNTQTSDLVTQLPYINSGSNGPGLDIIDVGMVNVLQEDTADPVTPENSIIDLQSAVNSRLRAGRSLVLLGISAMTDNGVALNAAEMAVLFAINDAAQQMAAQNPNRIIYIDTFSPTFDSTSTTAGYKSGALATGGMLLTSAMSLVIGRKIADALIAKGWVSYGVTLGQGDTRNLWGSAVPGYFMLGSAAAGGTGASGNIPTSWNASRISGDGTTAFSVGVDRDGEGTYTQCQYTGGAAETKFQLGAGSLSAASLGLVAGEQYVAEIEFDIDTASTGLVGMNLQLEWGSPLKRIAAAIYSGGDLGAVPGDVRMITPFKGKLRTPPFTHVAGTASYVWACFFFFAAASSGSVFFRKNRFIAVNSL